MQRDDYGQDYREYEVERVDTGFRILDSILYTIIFSLVESVLAAVVVFQLGYSLVTEAPPSRAVRDLGNRLSAYAYQLLRYMTHNSAVRPFPFSDFPQALEEPQWPYPARSGRRDERPESDYVDDADALRSDSR